MGVIVVGVCTNPDIKTENWKKSLEQNHYPYILLGENEKWKGWPWRTSKYLEALNALRDEDIVIFSDVSDVLFIRPSKELEQDFENFELEHPHKIIIGAEAACCTGEISKSEELKRDINILAKHITPDRYRFPNGGVLIGRVKNLIPFIKSNLAEEDDQVGYLKKWLKKRGFYLDTSQHFISNLPSISEGVKLFDQNNDEEIDYWNINSSREKSTYQHKFYKTTPYIIHFPGQNWKEYNRIGNMFIENFQNIETKQESKKQNNIFIYIIILIILLLIVYILFNIR